MYREADDRAADARMLKTPVMAGLPRAPRIWIDVEQGAIFQDPAATVDVFGVLSGATGPIREVWLFGSRTDAPLIRGFRYPPSLHERFGVPKGRGPGMVLVDERGDHQWFSGAGCAPEDAAAAAVTILDRLGLDRAGSVARASTLGGFDELHLVDGLMVGHRLLEEHAPSSPPGRTFVRDHRLVSRMEFDKGGVTATDLRELWSLSTERYGWLGPPSSLTRYDGRRRSEESGHDGCQLVAGGSRGRELWLQLPEADEYERVAAGRRRQRYEGAFSEYEAAERWIFRTVGADIEPPARSLRDTLLGRHPVPPPVIHWP